MLYNNTKILMLKESNVCVMYYYNETPVKAKIIKTGKYKQTIIYNGNPKNAMFSKTYEI